MNFTYGLELEFADVRYGQELPEGCSWNKQDGTIVNSNGVANCPNGKHWSWGGEINTKPTVSIDEQVQVVESILDILNPPPVINYRCNLHVHVGIRGLRDNLVLLKQLVGYIDRNQEDVFRIVDPIPIPCKKDFLSSEEYKGAVKRYRRRLRSHQSVLSSSQIRTMLSAISSEELYLAHFLKSKRTGLPQKQLHQRCGINIRSLWENDETIEFRHFPGSDNIREIASALVWCQQFLEHALGDTGWPIEIKNLQFPTFRPYIHDLERIYSLTYYKLPAKIIRENLIKLGFDI